MSEVNFTTEQLRAINGRGKDMIVSASAGSGKTTVMIRRIASLIAEGASLADMVVCTFTKASAADMRAKLYRELKTLSETDGRFLSQLALLPQARISTIHSFCQQLIKTFFYAVDADPDFEIASETQAAAMLTGCIEATVEKYLRAGDKDFLSLYEIMLKNRGASKLVSLVGRVYSFAACQTDFDEWLSGCLNSSANGMEHTEFLKNAMSADFEPFLTSAESLFYRTAEAGFTRNLPACEALVTAIKRKEASEVSPSGRKPTDGYLLDLNEEFLSLKSDYNKFVAKYRGIDDLPSPEKVLPLARALAKLTRDAAQSFAAAKKKKALLDYSDLEHYAAKILSDPETRAAADEKYKYVFVDEYQDVNPLQEKLISLLSARKFFVGDVKQSIYAFRMCDSSIFLKRYDKYLRGAGDAISLNANFRSDETILSFCNGVFSDIMTQDFGSIDYAGTAAFSERGGEKTQGAVRAALAVFETETQLAPPEIYSVKRHVGPTDETDLIGAETTLIVREIERLLSDKDNSPSDIAVLLRAMRGEYTKTLTRKLAERNIPFFVSDPRAADENPEINALISALKFINNHCDDIALCGVMRSYFGAFTDDELAEIREYDCGNGADGFFYEAVENYLSADPTKVNAELQTKLKRFYEKFERYTLLSAAVNVSRLLGVICAENDYFRYVYSAPGGETSACELAGFLDIAESGIYGGTLDSFLKNTERESPTLEATPTENAVKIMTVHASKGLEFKHVILGRIGKKFDKRDLSESVLLDSELGLSLKCFDSDEKTTSDTSLHARMKLIKERKLKEEEMRILYVALTRAKNSLFICGAAKKLPAPVRADRAESYLDWLYPHVKDFAEICDKDDCLSVAARDFGERRISENRPYDASLKDEIKRYIAPAPAEKRAPLKITVTSAARSGDETDENIRKVVFADDERGAETGSAYHLIMQNVSFFSPFESEWERLEKEFPTECALVKKSAVKAAVNKMETLIFQNGVEKVDKMETHVKVDKMETPVVAVDKMETPRKFYRELPFIVRLDASEVGAGGSGGILVQGIIDLLVETADGYTVVDYKSGEITEKRMSEYRKQVSLYALAVEKLLGKRVAKRYIYSFSTGELTEI